MTTKIAGQFNEVSLNIDDISFQVEEQDMNVFITDDIGLQMQYPTLMDITNISKLQSQTKQIFEMIKICTKSVFDSENEYDNFTGEELEQWIEGLNKDQFAKLVEFFNNIPELSHTLEFTCENCEKHNTETIRGFDNFFM